MYKSVFPFGLFIKFIGNVHNNAISSQQQFFKYINTSSTGVVAVGI